MFLNHNPYMLNYGIINAWKRYMGKREVTQQSGIMAGFEKSPHRWRQLIMGEQAVKEEHGKEQAGCFRTLFKCL